MQEIFLLGSERSGSNLLRTLLGNHSQISAPIAPHLCDVFYDRFRYYLPLDTIKRIELIKDINKYVNHDFNDWSVDLPYSSEEVSLFDSFIDFLNFTFKEKAKKDGKVAYFSKDNHIHKYALGILKDIPTAKFIYLYRDPRDHVASWMRTPVHIHTPYQAILKWKKEQEDILALRDFYKVNMFPVKYEDLVSKTEVVMSELLTYLGFKVEDGCFQTRMGNDEALKHPLWKNINKPIKKMNFNKYMDVLSQKDVHVVETVAAKVMSELGYSPISSQSWEKDNPYIFYIIEMLKTKLSVKKNKNFINKEMKVLIDKTKFTDQLFSKFQ